MTGFRLETGRLVVRDWEDGDVAPFLRVTNTPAVMRYLGGVMDDAKADAAMARLASYASNFGFNLWILERKADGGHLSGEMLGFCGLKRANIEPGPQGDIEIGWRLREDSWGHGYATESARAVLAHAFEGLAAPHVIAITVPENKPSQQVMRRIGMTPRPDLDFAPESKWAPDERLVVFAITREQWESQA